MQVIVDELWFCFCNSSFQKKRTTKAKQQEENGLHLKLKEYYSKKKSALNSEKSVAPSQTFTRGKLLQETSQRNKTLKLSESEPQNNAVDSAMETEDSNAILSNLDSEQTDVMDEDPPDMSGTYLCTCRGGGV